MIKSSKVIDSIKEALVTVAQSQADILVLLIDIAKFGIGCVFFVMLCFVLLREN